jgi:DNA polymerase I
MPKHQVVLPNVRKMFVPDPGFVIFDVDLAGADAQVVAAEAEDEDLRNAFKAGLDVHDKNARDLWGPAYSNLAGDKDNGPKSRRRKECKQGVHATNYGGSARTLAVVLGWSVHEADQFQKRWFSIHPGIKRNFHGRIEASIRASRTVKNKFGYRRVYFDRIDECFTEALAWVPQSTVAEVSFRGALQLEEQWDARYPESPMVVRPLSSDRRLAGAPGVRDERTGMLLQVHDSLVFQVPRSHAGAEHLKFIKSSLAVPIPYDDPLTIQWGIAMSEKSWGDCESVRIN